MDPSNADAIYVNGLCSYYYKGAMDVGLAYFQKALELYPDHGRARAMQIKAQNLKSKKDLGDNLFNAGRFSDAHQIYTEAIEIDPLNAIINLRLYFSRALTNSNIGNYQNAIQDCTCALKISPKSFEVLELRAKCYKAIENYEECVKDYVVAQEIQKTTENELALKDVWNTIRRNILLRYKNRFETLIMIVIHNFNVHPKFHSPHFSVKQKMKKLPATNSSRRETIQRHCNIMIKRSDCVPKIMVIIPAVGDV